MPPAPFERHADVKNSRFARIAVIGAALALTLTACTGTATNNDKPAGGTEAPVEFEAFNRLEVIAPAAPGSGWDQTARAVQASLQTEGLAKSVEVTNVAGASGTVALAQVAPKQGAKDLLMASGLAMMSGIISNGTPVSLDDLTPIARLIGENEVIVVPADSPYQSIDDLFAAIKKDPKSVPIAGGSAGSADHLFIGLLAQHYGVKPADVNYVPYSGGGEASTALLGNVVQAGIAGYSEFAAQIDSGDFRGLLISSETNTTDLEFAATAGDIDKSLVFANWRSIMAPGGISDELKAQYLEAFDQLHASDSWKQAMQTNGWEDLYLSGDEFGDWLTTENTRVESVLVDLGLATK